MKDDRLEKAVVRDSNQVWVARGVRGGTACAMHRWFKWGQRRIMVPEEDVLYEAHSGSLRETVGEHGVCRWCE